MGETVRGAWSALVHDVFGGDATLTLSIVLKNTGFLGTPGSTIRESWSFFNSLFGNFEIARSVVLSRPIVLRSSAATLRGCWEALVTELASEEQALDLVQREPR